MKKYIPIIVITLLMSMVGTKSLAHDIAVANSDGKTIYYHWIYNWTNNKKTLGVCYSYNHEYSGNIVIPESVTYNGTTYPVTRIESQAFYECYGLTSITIPNSVTSIGDEAFKETGLKLVTINCKEIYSWFCGMETIRDVTIGDGVTSISGNAFSGCSGLTSVTIGNRVTSIGSDAFYKCSSLRSINIPNSVTSIGNNTFSGCSGLTSITIPNSVTSIGRYAFYGCKGLTSITIPNGVTSIGSDVFRGCSVLTSITIPNSVTNIGRDAFLGTAWYNNQPNGLVYAGNVAYKYKGTMPKNTNMVLEEGTKTIGYAAFSGCSGLTSVTIPSSVTSIDYGAFSGCI